MMGLQVANQRGLFSCFHDQNVNNYLAPGVTSNETQFYSKHDSYAIVFLKNYTCTARVV